jgi:hypothetical protein
MDAPINGGIYPGRTPREAIIVDFEDSPTLQEMYSRVKNMIGNSYRYTRQFWNDEMDLVWAIMNVVETYTPHRGALGVKGILSRYPNAVDSEISLEVFAREGKGVCRHLGIMGALLYENLVREGISQGKSSVDRNMHSENGSHAWTRISFSSSKVYILDVMDGYYGPLSASATKHWHYERPEDNISV